MVSDLFNKVSYKDGGSRVLDEAMLDPDAFKNATLKLNVVEVIECVEAIFENIELKETLNQVMSLLQDRRFVLSDSRQRVINLLRSKGF